MYNRLKGSERGHMRRKYGFTLVELLVVIAIIGVLAVVIFPILASKIKTAHDGKAYATLSSMRSVLSSGIGEMSGSPPASSYANMHAIVYGGTLTANSPSTNEASVLGIDEMSRQLVTLDSGSATGKIRCGIFREPSGSSVTNQAPFYYKINNGGKDYEDGQIEFVSGTNSFNQNWSNY